MATQNIISEMKIKDDWHDLKQRSTLIATYIQLEPPKIKYKAPPFNKIPTNLPVAHKNLKNQKREVSIGLKNSGAEHGSVSVMNSQKKRIYGSSRIKNVNGRSEAVKSLANPSVGFGTPRKTLTKNDVTESAKSSLKSSASVKKPCFHAKKYKASSLQTKDKIPKVVQKKGNVLAAKTGSIIDVDRKVRPKPTIGKKANVINSIDSAIKSGCINNKSKSNNAKRQYNSLGRFRTQNSSLPTTKSTIKPDTKNLNMKFPGSGKVITPSRIPRAVGLKKPTVAVKLKEEQIINELPQKKPQPQLNSALCSKLKHAPDGKSTTCTISVTVSDSNLAKNYENKDESKSLDIAPIKGNGPLVLEFKKDLSIPVIETELPTTSAQASAKLHHCKHCLEIDTICLEERKKLYYENMKKKEIWKSEKGVNISVSKNVKKLVKSYEVKTRVRSREVEKMLVSRTNKNEVSVNNIKIPLVPKTRKEFKLADVGRKIGNHVTVGDDSGTYKRNDNTIKQINFARNVLRNNNLCKQRTSSSADTKKNEATSSRIAQENKKKNSPTNQVHSIVMKNEKKIALGNEIRSDKEDNINATGARSGNIIKMSKIELNVSSRDHITPKSYKTLEPFNGIEEVDETDVHSNEDMEKPSKSDLSLERIESCLHLKIQSDLEDTNKNQLSKCVTSTKDLQFSKRNGPKGKMKKTEEPADQKVKKMFRFIKSLSPVRLFKKMGGNADVSTKFDDKNVAGDE